MVSGSALHPRAASGGRYTALATDIRARGGDYVSVTAETSGYRPGDAAVFLWSPASAANTVFAAPFSWDGRDELFARLDASPAWSGEIAAIGVGGAGPRAAPITIRRLTLLPRTRAAAAASFWREWTAFEGLDAHSSNFVIGGSDQAKPKLRPVPAAAVWVALAIALHCLGRMTGRRRPEPGVCAAVVLAGWFVLDARWQVDLMRQLGFTRERYAGKSSALKRLAAEDADLFRFAEEVKARLPPSPQVVYLLAPEPAVASRYFKLRLRYHLLPHNVCTYYSVPPQEVSRGEYLVVAASSADLVYDEAAKTLRDPQNETPVDRILVGGPATVYRRR